MARRYVSTYNIRCWKQHTCSNCGAVYSYEFVRSAKARGSSPEAAQRNAQAAAGRMLAGNVDVRPCPTCGVIQPDMIGQQRRRAHVVILVVAFAVLAVLLGLRAGDALPANVATWVMVAACAAVAAFQAGREWLDMNRDLEANRRSAADRIAAGKMQLHTPGQVGAAAAAAASRGLIQRLALMMLPLALLLAACPELLRIAHGWPLSPEAYPPVVGPADTTRLYMQAKISSIMGYWRGSPHAVLRLPGGQTVDLQATTNQNNWGSTINAKEDEKDNSTTPWVEVQIPPDAELAGKEVACDVRLDIDYPHVIGSSNFQVQHTFLTRNQIPLKLATMGAGREYKTAWWVGSLLAVLLLLACGALFILAAMALQKSALPAGVFNPSAPAPPAPAAAPPEKPIWYYLVNDQQVGPVTLSAMRARAASGDLIPTDLVWKNGWADWGPASNVKEFFAPAPTPAMPPPLPVAALPATPAKPSGGGMPVWGWALIGFGAFSIIMLVLAVAWVVVPSLSRAREAANRVKCANNMRHIGLAIRAYASTHSGVLPATPQDLLLNSTLDASDFVCPGGSDTPAPGVTRPEQAANLTVSHLSYIYLPRGDLSGRTILFYEKPQAHRGEGSNVLFGDGHVEFIMGAQVLARVAQSQAAAVQSAMNRIAQRTQAPWPQVSAPIPLATSSTKRTPLVGGKGGGTYTRFSSTGENVVGFRYDIGTWSGNTIVHTLEPIYASTASRPASKRLQVVQARTGYIVGGMLVDGKDYANAIRIIFIAWDGTQTHPEDTYMSDWLGTPIDDQPTQLAGHGERVIGIHGRRGLNFDALGLVLAADSQ